MLGMADDRARAKVWDVLTTLAAYLSSASANVIDPRHSNDAAPDAALLHACIAEGPPVSASWALDGLLLISQQVCRHVDRGTRCSSRLFDLRFVAKLTGFSVKQALAEDDPAALAAFGDALLADQEPYWHVLALSLLAGQGVRACRRWWNGFPAIRWRWRATPRRRPGRSTSWLRPAGGSDDARRPVGNPGRPVPTPMPVRVPVQRWLAGRIAGAGAGRWVWPIQGWRSACR